MSGDLDWLLNLDALAQKHGAGGLHPKLAQVLRERRDTIAAGAVPLNPKVRSAGPAHQTFSADDLIAAGIARIGPAHPAAASDDQPNRRKPSQS